MCLQSRRYLGPVSGHGGVQGVHGANGDPRHVRSDTRPLTGVGQAGRTRERAHIISHFCQCVSACGGPGLGNTPTFLVCLQSLHIRLDNGHMQECNFPETFSEGT